MYIRAIENGISYAYTRYVTSKKDEIMKYAIMLGSNMFIGTDGVFTVEINGTLKEFFKVREIFRERSYGSFLVVDCDIKDIDNKREVKLFKSKPVAADENIQFGFNEKEISATRPDGSVIIKIEQLKDDDSTLPKSGPIREQLKENPVDAILRITGNFYAGDFEVNIDNESMKIDDATVNGNLSIGTGGMQITRQGFSM